MRLDNSRARWSSRFHLTAEVEVEVSMREDREDRGSVSIAGPEPLDSS